MLLNRRYPSKQSSQRVFMSHCSLYKLEMLLKRSTGLGHASLGMTLPNGTFEGPINHKRLYSVYPGMIDVQV